MLNYLTFNGTKIQRFSLKDCLQIPRYRPSKRPSSTPLRVGLPSSTLGIDSRGATLRLSGRMGSPSKN